MIDMVVSCVQILGYYWVWVEDFEEGENFAEYINIETGYAAEVVYHECKYYVVVGKEEAPVEQFKRGGMSLFLPTQWLVWNPETGEILAKCKDHWEAREKCPVNCVYNYAQQIRRNEIGKWWGFLYSMEVGFDHCRRWELVEWMRKKVPNEPEEFVRWLLKERVLLDECWGWRRVCWFTLLAEHTRFSHRFGFLADCSAAERILKRHDLKISHYELDRLDRTSKIFLRLLERILDWHGARIIESGWMQVLIENDVIPDEIFPPELREEVMEFA